jgi:hypothetical protein
MREAPLCSEPDRLFGVLVFWCVLAGVGMLYGFARYLHLDWSQLPFHFR